MRQVKPTKNKTVSTIDKNNWREKPLSQSLEPLQ